VPINKDVLFQTVFWRICPLGCAFSEIDMPSILPILAKFLLYSRGGGY